MTKAERTTVRLAIKELMAEEPSFTAAIGRLCRLVGWVYPVAEMKETETITVDELMRRHDAKKRGQDDRTNGGRPSPVYGGNRARGLALSPWVWVREKRWREDEEMAPVGVQGFARRAPNQGGIKMYTAILVALNFILLGLLGFWIRSVNGCLGRLLRILTVEQKQEDFEAEEARDERHHDLIANGIEIGWSESGDVGLWLKGQEQGLAYGDTVLQVIDQAADAMFQARESGDE
jgi:hypothetical protein